MHRHGVDGHMMHVHDQERWVHGPVECTDWGRSKGTEGRPELGMEELLPLSRIRTDDERNYEAVRRQHDLAQAGSLAIRADPITRAKDCVAADEALKCRPDQRLGFVNCADVRVT